MRRVWSWRRHGSGVVFVRRGPRRAIRFDLASREMHYAHNGHPHGAVPEHVPRESPTVFALAETEAGRATMTSSRSRRGLVNVSSSLWSLRV